VSDRRPYPEKARSRIEASNAIDLLLENANRPSRKDAAPRILKLLFARAKGRQWDQIDPIEQNSISDLLVKEFSNLELSNAQVQGLLGLVKKVLPDTAQFEVKGGTQHTHVVMMPPKVHSSADWTRGVIEAEVLNADRCLESPAGATDLPVAVPR
jgi:hypothetical protein